MGGPSGRRWLLGIAPTDIGFHASVAGATLTPDAKGVWYTAVRAGTPNFTITTNHGTSSFPLDQAEASPSTVAVTERTP
jgi:hypothetical protein